MFYKELARVLYSPIRRIYVSVVAKVDLSYT